MTNIIGIDLGTTNSSAAVWRDGSPHMIPSADGSFVTPSVVAFDPEKEEWVVGQKARDILQQDPWHVVKSIKRFVGRRFRGKAFQEELEKLHVLYKVEESSQRRGGIDVVLGSRHLTPQEVSAKILQKIKSDAEIYLDQEVTEAVITVPAYFNASQRQATRDAGRIAGLEVKRVLNEPTAACLAFGYKKLAEERKTVAVYDLGGGTFDISILDVGRGPFRVRATNGNTLLGGDDLDWMILNWVLDQIGETEKEKLTKDVVAQARILAAVEQAKIILSEDGEAMVEVPGQLSPTCQLNDLALKLTRAQLEHLSESLIEQTLEPCGQALHDAKLSTSEIKEVLMVGGQTRMPAIRHAVKEFFGIEPNINVNPEEVVTLGAAVQAGILAGDTIGIVLSDVVPLTLGVRAQGGLMDTLIPRNTAIPIRKTKIYTTTTDDQDSVEIRIYQGEKPHVADNVKLGSFTLSGIEPAPAGQPEIEVTFQVDENGILHVSAKDIYTEQVQEIDVDTVQLSDNEIKKMIQDAEKHAVEYAKKRRQIELRQQAEQLCSRLNHLLVEKGSNLSAELVTAIQKVQDIPTEKNLEPYISDLRDLWRKVNEAVQ
ncbi:MAG: molecular chaperone DnaK [Candidatus Aminicenantes bacterium]|nr:MAG: molecular chaperone DnaK [Candidatus Aminicenantes bacterium]